MSILLGIFAAALMPVDALHAQDPSSQPPYLSQPGFADAANLWMTTPVACPLAKDTVPTSVRDARNTYFDQLIGNREALTPATAKGSGLSEGVSLSNQPEIPNFPDRSIVIATFISYQPILTRSQRAIYTEITFAVTNVFEDHSELLNPGGTLTVIVPGGSVAMNGAPISFLTQPRKYFVSPGRTYLLTLGYHAEETFFVLGKTWDVTDGLARANFPISPRTPTSLLGLNLQQLTEQLKNQFSRK